MNTKLIYSAFACLTMTCSIANASYITNGEKDDKRLASYSGGSSGNNTNIGSFKGNNSPVNENVDFSKVNFDNAAQYKGTQDLKIGDELLRVNFQVQHLGDDFMISAGLMKDLKEYLRNYKPGMTNAPKQIEGIVITEKDKTKMEYFGNFVLENLFQYHMHKMNVPQSFKTFKEADSKLFNDFKPYPNCIMFSLMYVFESDQTPIEIKHETITYNDYAFRFLPCNDKEGGTDMKFLFDRNKDRFLVSDKSADSIKKYLTKYKTGTYESETYVGEFKFSMFKVGENTYRLNVKLSSEEYPTKEIDYYKTQHTLKDRKITNFLLEIK